MAPVGPRSGDAIFSSIDRVNAELFTLTYGAIVRQLLTDLEEVEEVNKQLDQMYSSSTIYVDSLPWGYNIGIRLIDEFLAKSGVSRCVDFKETAEMIAKVGFKMFLGVTASVTSWDADGTCCSIILEDNPLVDFVELPDTCQGLYYCNVLSGVIRGALEMVSMKTEVTWTRDVLRGDDAYELQVKLLKQVAEEYPYKDDE
ncbi:putative transport protein particle (TRAPP) component [Arabidopsis thaliana]